MATVISLFDLANLSIGTPEVGAVNFNALHALLHAIIKHLNIQDVQAEVPEEERDLYKPPGGLGKVEGQDGRVPSVYHQMERKILEVERQLEALNKLPTGAELIERAKAQEKGSTAVEDMWQMMQMKKRLEANESGVSKAMGLMQDLLHEINSLRDSQHEVVEGWLQKVEETVGPVNLLQLDQRLNHMELKRAGEGDVDNQKELESIQKRVKDLEDNLAKFPNPDDLNNMVQWEVLRKTLVRRPVTKDAQTSYTVLPSGHVTTPISSKTTLLKRITSKTLPEEPPTSAPMPTQAVGPTQVTEVTESDGQTFTASTSQTIVTPAQGSIPAGDTQGEMITPVITQEGVTMHPSVTSQAGMTSQQMKRDLTPTHPGGPVPQYTGIPPSVSSLEPTHPPGSPGIDHSPSSFDQRSTPAAESHPTLHQRIQKDNARSSPASPNHPDTPSFPSHGGSASERYAETSEALRNIGALSEEYALLQARLEVVERDKADRTELKLLQENTDDCTKSLPDLQEKLSSLYREIQDLKGDREKLDRLQRALCPVVSQSSDSSDQKVEETSKISLQLGYLSATIQDIEKELKELRDNQEQGKTSMEQSVAEKSLHLQEQLDKLRGVLQNMISSSSTLLAMSLPSQPDSSPQPSTTTLQPELLAEGGTQAPPHVLTTTSQPQFTCPACSIDVGEKVSQLVSRYEQLQELVTGYISRQAEGKTRSQQDRKASPLRIQDGQLLGHIQNTMMQLQEECERLNKTTGSLVQDHQQKQRHIDILYQTLEELDEKKADKEHTELEIDVKADKHALEGKVSRTQFDATAEQLSSMIQDLLDRVSGQEQDWQRVLEKINREMQSKLDRMELDPLKNKLEERWKDIRRQLQERPPQYESDEAAGIRKQLITRFHCISCARPVDMMVPGPQILTIPSIPGLPAHRSNRPYTVYELEQVRQHSHSDHIPELSDYGYMSSSRSCGGSHTMTFPHRRYVRLQGINPSYPQEEEIVGSGLKKEVEIQGLDGHIYRGRMDFRLPAIHTKDGISKAHLKYTQGSKKPLPTFDGSIPHSRPQSAISTGRNSVLSQTSLERPCSASLGRLYPQADLTRSRETIEVRMDMTLNQQCLDKSVM